MNFGGKEADISISAQETKDGGDIIARGAYSFGSDSWLIKTDQKGNEEWNRTFRGKKIKWGYSVKQTKDGGHIIAGYRNSFGARSADVWFIKIEES